MKPIPDIAAGFAVALATAAFTWSTFQWWTARNQLAAARAGDLQAAALISEVRQLRALPIIVEDSAVREDRLLGMVSDSLVQAGVNPSAIRGVSSESNSAGSGPYRRQSIRVQLDPISVPDVGRFLSNWKSRHPTWIPTSLNLAPMQRSGGGKRTETPVLWSVSIFFTSSFLGSSTPTLAPAEPPVPINQSPRPTRSNPAPEKPTK